MTRKEAKERIQHWLDIGSNGLTDETLGYMEGWFSKDDCIAFKMAIKALDQQPCEDCISRLDVIELISDIKDTVFGQTVIKGVETLPSVQPKMTVEQAQNIIVDDFSRTVQTVNKILDRDVIE